MFMQNKNIVLFDDLTWEDLLPLTFTRPVCDIRVGITTIRQKWERVSNKVSCITQDYLSAKFPNHIENDTLFVNASLIPEPGILSAISALNTGEYINHQDKLLAFSSDTYNPEQILAEGTEIMFKGDITYIENIWDIFEMNEKLINLDFELLTARRNSQPLSNSNNIIGPGRIFIEEGASIEFATLNTKTGPIYIGKDAEIMEGAMIRGPFALGEHSTVKMGAKIYGATTIGPHCKVAGEIQNSVFFGYSNKGHDGYLGNAVLGEWCNIGADSNNSNLKNNYEKVKLWNYKTARFVNTNLQFCGLIMGDHSKCGINTMFNTGTVIGVSANVFGAGFPRNFIPSFSWGGAAGFTDYTLNKALATAEIVMARRNLPLTDMDKHIMETVFNLSAKYRK
jgi:UDP-N-acetylglucosamine diphosphorylase/glucosamine-1-phosphate N-acetyltransferase